DFPKAIEQLDVDTLAQYEGRLDEVPGIFGKMPPMEEAIESYAQLSEWFDTYILSTAPWENQTAWSDKLNWVKSYLGGPAYNRLILSHNKHLNRGDYLIDDRLKNGADRFPGVLIHFKTELFPDWPSVMDYLKDRK
ncbi:MAG: hypothetical protein E4H26_06160, partial [Flavobacteriales bacterium]